MVKINTVVIEPSIIAADPAHIADEVKKCQEAGIKMIHVDIMDGHFVPNLTYGPSMVSAIRRCSKDIHIDVHLMVYQPFDWVERFASAGANHISFHLESTEDVEDTITFIRRCNMKVGIALRPETSESLVLKYLDKIDRVLVMTVNPGFGGQEFMEEMLPKVEFLREKCDQLNIPMSIQVDGGINLATASLSIKAGASHLVCGTAFFKSPDYKQMHQELLISGNR
jgi:ribulose-phosphate 3-epimerase